MPRGPRRNPTRRPPTRSTYARTCRPVKDLHAVIPGVGDVNQPVRPDCHSPGFVEQTFRRGPIQHIGVAAQEVEIQTVRVQVHNAGYYANPPRTGCRSGAKANPRGAEKVWPPAMLMTFEPGPG